MKTLINAWKSSKTTRIVVIALTLLSLTCCCVVVATLLNDDKAGSEEPGAAAAAEATDTVQPTETAQPTATLAATDTPAPTDTSAPTGTPAGEAQATLPSEGPIDLAFDVDIETTDGFVEAVVSTNLPDDMIVMFTLSEGDEMRGQAKEQVLGGTVSAGPFSNKGAPFLAGEYSLSVSTPLLRIQPESVQDAVGPDGANYRGPLWNEGRVDTDVVFTVEGDVEAANAIRAAELEALSGQIDYLRGKAEELEQAKSKTVDTWTGWIREWNIDLSTRWDAYREEFGADINEYTGNCRSAFFNISVAYGDTAILWRAYDDFITGDGSEAEIGEWKSVLADSLTEAEAAITNCRDR